MANLTYSSCSLDAHVGLGTTAMSGFVPLVLSFRVLLSINPKWAVTAKLLECYYTPFQVDRSRGEKGHHFRISVVSPTHQLSLI